MKTIILNLEKLKMKELIKRSSTEYNSWRSIKERCQSLKHKEYKYYGARGIIMCDRWASSSQAFFEDMGRKPASNYSIDRIDVDGDYHKANCRWATHQEQQRNKRNSIDLTESDVRNMRLVPRTAANGRGLGYTRKDIAEMFCVPLATTVRILRGVHYSCEK
jgi:phosphatidate phosphatase PAH1